MLRCIAFHYLYFFINKIIKYFYTWIKWSYPNSDSIYLHFSYDWRNRKILWFFCRLLNELSYNHFFQKILYAPRCYSDMCKMIITASWYDIILGILYECINKDYMIMQISSSWKMKQWTNRSVQTLARAVGLS